MSASSCTATASSNVVVVTQIQPNITTILPAPPATGTGPINPAGNRGRPVVVGTVQIIIGLLVLIFGIIMGTHRDKLVVHSGVFIWGPGMSILAGCLTVAAGISLSGSKIKQAVSFNAVAAVISIVSTVIFFLDMPGLLSTSDPFPGFGNNDDNMNLNSALTGVSAVFSFGQSGLALAVATSSCRDSCYTTAQCPVAITNQVYGNTSVTLETPHSCQAPPPPYEKPPEYSGIFT